MRKEYNMGIHIGKHDRSSSWIGRFDPQNPEDMKEYEMVKAVVRSCNSSKTKFRVEKKGRKPTNGFTYFGDPKGGIKNATLWDVYVYRRYSI
jgi:hypothetical protein